MTDNSSRPGISQADHDALRALADSGNENALDRLADLADERNDVAELNDLLDEGNELAGEHLTTRAVAARDLVELQRLADEGIEAAQRALDGFLR